MASYLTAEEAQELAESVGGVGLAAFLAKDDDTQAGLLLLASIDVDAAGPWQGRKYDATPGAQEREFPRIPYGDPRPPYAGACALGIVDVWDWDPEANDGAGGAVVPQPVLLAVLYQAEWLCHPEYAARVEAIKTGLAAQSDGEASETYAVARPNQPGGGAVADRAARLLRQYELKSGSLL